MHFFILFTSSTIDKFQYNIVTHILGANTPKMGAVLSRHIGNVEIVTTTDNNSDQIEQFQILNSIDGKILTISNEDEQDYTIDASN